jgi:diadenosine tetraphosphate (Ap4A) HIT family hydrolase
MRIAGCELCNDDGGTLVLANEWLRVVLVDDPDYPGFARVIWNDHVREMTDLDFSARRRLMDTALAVESAQREVLSPLKVNLASLGNVTPHLHWHVVPRFVDDAHFPLPIWGTRQRSPAAEVLTARRTQLPQLRSRIAEEVARIPYA